jgi:acetyltransferase-like isoleucine patch superfamily enzyme
MNPIRIFHKSIKKILAYIRKFVDKLRCSYIFSGNNVKYSHFQTNGVPYVMVAWGGNAFIGNNFSMNNGIRGNPIGSYRPCTFFVDKGADLYIGDNVGISQTALICHKSIKILNNVKMGGGTSVYDTDFHPLDPDIRKQKNDIQHKEKAPVVIEDNVFIGAHVIILKGVTIGENSIVGAGSVVTKSIPPNQIWAGNPAKFIRNVE